MHISKISIRNFRNFLNGKFNFQSGINSVIGENGSGKTNLFFAIRVLIDDTLPRRIKFRENDFNRALGKWEGHWIIIKANFDGLDSSEEAQCLAIQVAGKMNTNSEGSYSIYFRPNYLIRKELYDYSKKTAKNKGGLNAILKKITIDDYESVYLSRGSADFNDDDVYKKYVGDFDLIDFPNPDEKEESTYGVWLPKEISIHQEISCTFIKALRDVASDLRSYNNNPLINLLRGKEKTVEVTEKEEIEESIENLNDQIGELKEVQEVQAGIENSINSAIGTTYSPNIELRSELPNDMEKLLQSLKLWVGDPYDEGYKGRLRELSLGGANLIYLSLKFLEYDNIRTDRIGNFLLIEEPEAHIHTHIQKTLFENLKNSKTQVILSSHSTHISSVNNISSINILSCSNNKALVFQPANKLSKEEINHVERYLDAIRSNLLFAQGNILVEGDAEQILIPEMVKKCFGFSLDEIGVSLTNIGSTGFKNISCLFHQDRIQKKCSILTDLDSPFVKLPKDSSIDDNIQKKIRASAKSGKERYADLNNYCKGNIFVEPFYATHTFEVDLIANKNSHEYVQLLEKIYKREKEKKESKEKLENDSIEIFGTEALRLANKEGKGWFALLLSERLLYNTYIPDYILQAIAFASSRVNKSTLLKAIKYRINKISSDKENSYKKEASKFKFDDLSVEDLISNYSNTFKEDDLTKFINLL